jgi:hypothetical protein
MTLPKKTAPKNTRRQRTDRKVAMAFHPRPSLDDFYGQDLDSFDFQLIFKIDNQAMLKAQHNSSFIVYLLSMGNQKDLRRQKQCVEAWLIEKRQDVCSLRYETKKRRGAVAPPLALKNQFISVRKFSPSREIP